MRKAAMTLTVLLWSALLFQAWPLGALTSPDMAGSVGLFVMLLLAIGLATLASFPLFATGVYLAGALLAIAAGSLGYTGLPLYYGLGLLALTWISFRYWRAWQVATVDVPLLVNPAGKQNKGKKQRRSRKAPARRRRVIWAWGAAAVVAAYLVHTIVQPYLPGVEATPSSAAQTGAVVDAEPAPEPNSLAIVAYVDGIFWRVLAVESLGQVLPGSGPIGDLYRTVGQHIRVRVEVENRNDAPRTYTGFKLVDDQAGVTARSLTSLWYVPDNERCVLKVLRPGTTQRCSEIFRMSKNATDLQALVNDLKLFGQEEAVQVALGIPLTASPHTDPQVVEDEPTFFDTLLRAVTPASIQPHLNNNANLRAGPSMEYAVVGKAAAGDNLDLAGQNAASDWYQLRSGEWIAANLVLDPPTGLPVVP